LLPSPEVQKKVSVRYLAQHHDGLTIQEP